MAATTASALLGGARWRSDEVYRYLHVQAQPVMASVDATMLCSSNFCVNLPPFPTFSHSMWPTLLYPSGPTGQSGATPNPGVTGGTSKGTRGVRQNSKRTAFVIYLLFYIITCLHDTIAAVFESESLMEAGKSSCSTGVLQTERQAARRMFWYASRSVTCFINA